MQSLPRPQQPVTLRDVTQREYAAEAAYLDDGSVVLRRPADFAAPPEFGPGYRLEVMWPAERGILALPVEVAEAHEDGEDVLWLARTVGVARREQRRGFVRVTMETPMTLHDGDTAHHATLIDVSEAGLRARVKGEPQLTANATVRAAFSVDRMAFLVDAEVLRVHHRRDEEHHEVVLVFSLDERSAAELRRAVFSEQIRQRHLLPEAQVSRADAR